MIYYALTYIFTLYWALFIFARYWSRADSIDYLIPSLMVFSGLVFTFMPILVPSKENFKIPVKTKYLNFTNTFYQDKPAMLISGVKTSVFITDEEVVKRINARDTNLKFFIFDIVSLSNNSSVRQIVVEK